MSTHRGVNARIYINGQPVLMAGVRAAPDALAEIIRSYNAPIPALSIPAETMAFTSPFDLWVERRDERLRAQYGAVIPRKLRRASLKALRREWVRLLDGLKGAFLESLRKRDGREVPIVELGVNGLVHERDAQGDIAKMDVRSMAVLPPRGGG